MHHAIRQGQGEATLVTQLYIGIFRCIAMLPEKCER